MAVAITDAGFKTRPLHPGTQLMLPGLPGKIHIPFDWTFSAQGAGDATGGAVTIAIDFSFNKKVYFYITKIYPYNDNSHECMLSTHTDRWERSKYPGHANEEFPIWASACTSHYTIPFTDQIKKFIYLGRISEDTNKGECTFSWDTNTDAKIYNLLMTGFATNEPLPIGYHY